MKKLLPWIGAVALIVIIFGTQYTVAQQAQRRDANYPQIQLAEDAATALNNSHSPASVTASLNPVSLNSSLAPFVVIYDKSGKAVSGSGKLDSNLPAAPLGILSGATGQTYHAVTWQPQANVRIAAVTVAADKYYVLSGRSLTEVEKNESQSFQLSFIGGVGSLIVLAFMYVGMTPHRRATKRR